MSSATNQGTNSPKNEQADPLGSSNTKGDTSKGVPGNEQRGTGELITSTCFDSKGVKLTPGMRFLVESSHAKQGGNEVSDAAIAVSSVGFISSSCLFTFVRMSEILLLLFVVSLSTTS